MVGDGENNMNTGCKTEFIKRAEVEVNSDVIVERQLEFLRSRSAALSAVAGRTAGRSVHCVFSQYVHHFAIESALKQ